MLEHIKYLISVFLLIPMVTIAGFYLSYRLRFLQCTHWLKALKFFIKDRDPGQKSNSFSAVSAVLGGNLGTGNIAGIAVALSTGGPGAIFWMWIMATLGAILKFVGCALGILYRHRNIGGEFVGGPMHYLAKGLKMPNAAKLFCFFTAGSALTVGNLVQMNSLALPLTDLGIPPLLTGFTMAVLVGTVIIGGLKRFSQVVSKVVPIMALFYIVTCSIILLFNLPKLLPALQLILQSAFAPTPILGGIAGYSAIEAIRSGFDRGLFATDVGVGLAPIIHASVESHTSRIKTALTQGLISTLSPLIVMFVCTLTGLVLITTGAWQITGLQSTNVCNEAFRIGLNLPWAGHIVTITLFFFAFTTILTWSFCADKAIEYLFSSRWIRPFQTLFVLFIPLGTFFQVSLVWSLADVFLNCMLIINLIGVIGLSQQIIKKVNQSPITDS
jgi:AGCS family alanine or glycine:cation symporter